MNARAPGAIQSPAVSADQRHQEMKMAALVNPAVFLGNELGSSKPSETKALMCFLVSCGTVAKAMRHRS